MNASGLWYGLPILAVDLVAIATLACVFWLDRGQFEFPVPVYVAAALVLVLGGPLVHFWNGHGTTALASLALRLLLPLAFAFLGKSVSPIFHSPRGNIGDLGPVIMWASAGMTTGFVTAIGIDVTVLSGATGLMERNLVLVTLGVVGVSCVTLLVYLWTRP